MTVYYANDRESTTFSYWVCKIYNCQNFLYFKGFNQTPHFLAYIFVSNAVHIYIIKSLKKILPARFFLNQAGHEPVRIWLNGLSKDDRQIVGGDIRSVEFGWPKGMPLCRSIANYKGLWEVRSRLSGGRIARVIFYIKDDEMVLLNGFEKKSQKTPQNELELADKRKKEYEQHG